jgi:hypothetical protein
MRRKPTLHPPPGSFRSGTVIRSSHDEHRLRIELYEVPGTSRMTKLAIRDLSALDHAGGWRTNVPIACQVRDSPTQA